MNSGTLLAAVVNLNGPGRYLHWSIFTVSEANLVLIAVMVVIFGAALLIPFPGMSRTETSSVRDGARRTATGAGRRAPPAPLRRTLRPRRRRRRRHVDVPAAPAGAAACSRRASCFPDRQPAYVASWIYVFGVASLATLGMVIVSGFAIALGGPDWWHTNPVGHFFNSLHLWSVEAFMAFMVIHLWGKFWMAAWRGRRAVTWITGVVAFMASVVECFTGYLSQQNFDSQWISTSGKDAFNAVGVGAFFNLMNFGQMLMWHIVLIPLVLVAAGRRPRARRAGPRGGPPAPGPPTAWPGGLARGGRCRRPGRWRGPTRRYDIVKEATVATWSPPSWSSPWPACCPLPTCRPSPSPPGPRSPPPTSWPPRPVSSPGRARPPPTARPTTTGPAAAAPPVLPRDHPRGPPAHRRGPDLRPRPPGESRSHRPRPRRGARPLQRCLGRQVQAAWATAYANAVTKVTLRPVRRRARGRRRAGAGADRHRADPGPQRRPRRRPHLQQGFYGTDSTKPLLFLEDGQYFSNIATADHLSGTQWGVMNETGSYPGQPWLWLYTLWYQVPGFDNSANVDLIAIYLTGAATILLLAIPFIPGCATSPAWSLFTASSGATGTGHRGPSLRPGRDQTSRFLHPMIRSPRSYPAALRHTLRLRAPHAVKRATVRRVHPSESSTT